MAFIIDQPVIYIKLTNTGRDLLSKGELNFSKFAIGDSEVDYNYLSLNPNVDPDDMSILRPHDDEPDITSFILKSPSASTLNDIEQPINSVVTTKRFEVEPKGIFNANPNVLEYFSNALRAKQTDAIVKTEDILGGNQLILFQANDYGRNLNEPEVGDYLFIKWGNPEYTGSLHRNLKGNNDIVQLTYKITSIIEGELADPNNGIVVTVDREIPNFSDDTTNEDHRVLIYPNNNQRNTLGDAIQTYYGAPFVSDYVSESVLTFQENFAEALFEVDVWNMTIIHTREIEGVQAENKKLGQMPNVEFAGFVRYIERLDPVVENVGVIHYTNLSPENIYGEEFYIGDDKLPTLTIPHVMWHKNTLNDDVLILTSDSSTTDNYPDLNTPYVNLIDNGVEPMVVGKIFPALKLFIIEDQELLAALTYKSNRNWTLPPSKGAFNLEPCDPIITTTTVAPTTTTTTTTVAPTTTTTTTAAPFTGTRYLIQTDLGAGNNGSNTFELPLLELAFGAPVEFDFTVDWGDGSTDTITDVNDPATLHTYASTGEYVITITGTLNGWTFGASTQSNALKMKDVLDWGQAVTFNGISNAFKGCTNLTSLTATDTPILLNGVAGFFDGCTNLTANATINNWDISNVVSIGNFFNMCQSFNQDISGWDVSNVGAMNFTFAGCTIFNQDIGGWNVSNVQTMESMFNRTGAFNQDIGGWDVSNVFNMGDMFNNALAFNQDISGWDMSGVSTASRMFSGAVLFNQDIGGWNVSNISGMRDFFRSATSFDQNIGSWDIAGVSDMQNMFEANGLSTANYDALLLGWEAQNVQNSIQFDGGTSRYTANSAAAAARQRLIDDHSWFIEDNGAV